MKSLLVFIRILVVGILWGIVFTEGIRVIMLCNWHFDIFWPDHWRQAWTLWKAGWVVRAPKEWAFVLLIVTFFPMLFTGWWTLSIVSWEDIIWKIITLPVTLYNKLVKTPVNIITTNNKYGVVKRKSYKQIRPAGISSAIRTPISDYGDKPAIANTPSITFSSANAAAPTFSSLSSSSAYSSKPAPKKAPDVAATIDHALFKFDDDDDFDLDIDSFEKTDIKKKNAAPAKKAPQNEEIKKKVARFDFDDDDKTDSKSGNIFDDDFDDEPPAKTNRRDSKKNDKETRGDRSQSRDDNKDKDKNKRNNRDKKAENTDKSEHDEQEDSRSAHSPVYDALVQKNYAVITNVTAGSTTVDYIGVSGDEICLCLVDKESGDWLADEEMFNGEEPLWFSESSHRISPVRKLNVARDIISDKLEDEGFEQKLSSFVVIQMANIINADDMFDIWSEMDIEVTRINRGAPKEIKLFSKTLNDAGTPLPKKDLDRLRKLLKNLK
ncbi:MAG: hypothetical protein J6N49_03625 [Alphaproteobacteria bacterium]|nr:hypothetical protein [Alphaproteobacteria bacterium]